MVPYQWRPIEDLPDDWQSLARPDLDQMLRLWNEERQHLKNPERVRELEGYELSPGYRRQRERALQ